MTVETIGEYRGDLRNIVTHGVSGYTVETDEPHEDRKELETFSPTDFVSAGVATCVLTLMGLAAKRADVDITGTRVRVVKEMVSKPNRRIGRLDVIVTYPEGIELTDKLRKVFSRLPEACPVTRSLHPDIEFNVRFEN
jgi:uncharacterized OsmC-like protein